jgi:hypothetical protein
MSDFLSFILKGLPGLGSNRVNRFGCHLLLASRELVKKVKDPKKSGSNVFRIGNNSPATHREFLVGGEFIELEFELVVT